MKIELNKYCVDINLQKKYINWLKREVKEQSQSEVEHVIDYLVNQKPSVAISYNRALKNTKKWLLKLNTKGSKIIETTDDVEVIKKFRDGFRIVKLLTQKAYDREGFIMGHCVASYFGKDDDIYSLRDKDNMSHCTMSSNSRQIKGKGNGSIHPKYVKYAVAFLELHNIEVRDSEMENLGYRNVESLIPYIKNKKLFRGKYLFNKEQIIIKKGYVLIDNIEKLEKYDGNKKIIYDASLDLEDYYHKLPSSFTYCSGYLYLSNYSHKLPSGFTSCGGYLYLSNYSHKLPSGFTSCGGNLDLEDYSHKLPSGFNSKTR